jgi:FkbM family methyltransferase
VKNYTGRLNTFYKLAETNGVNAAVDITRLFLTQPEEPHLVNMHPFGPMVVRPNDTDLRMLLEVTKFSHYKLPDWWVRNQPAGSEVSVLDLGANIGSSSIYFYNQLLAGDLSPKVLAVEPELNNFGMVQTNISMLNRWQHIKAIQCAVWGSSGTCNLHVGDFGSCSYSASMCPEGRIPVKTINSLLVEHKLSPKIIKMDTEGAELNVFSGDLGFLGGVELFYIEHHSRFGPEFQDLPEIIDRAMYDQGFVQDVSYGDGQDLLYVNRGCIG